MRVLGLLLLLATGCGAPCTTLSALRCNRNLVEVCASDLKWRTVMDCDALARPKGDMRCVSRPEKNLGATCLPASEARP